MSRLCLNVLGPGLLTLDGATVRLHSQRTLALLAFLAMEANRPVSRARLADLLWADLPEAAGRHSLRQALYSLREVGDGEIGRCLLVGHDLVRFAPERGIDIDVRRFVDAVRGTDELRWHEAAAWYRAPLLDGRSLEHCHDFEAWLAIERERLRVLAILNLDRLAGNALARSQPDAALEYARALRELDPAGEASFQYLCRIHSARGTPEVIDEDWSRLCASLERIGIRPTEESAALYRALHRSPANPLAPKQQPAEGGSNEWPGEDAATPIPDDVESIVRAARAFEGVGAFSHAADLHRRALEILERTLPAQPRRRCEVLLLAEATLDRLGRRAEQRAVVDAASSIAESLGDLPSLATILLRRTNACAYLGQYIEASHFAYRALAILREIGDRPGQAEALRELAFVSWRAEDGAKALQLTREALALHRQIGDVAGEATAVHNLAEIHRGLGSPLRAAELFEEAMRLHWSARSRAGEILSLFGWGRALHQSGDREAARQKYEAALVLSEQHGERTLQARALQALAMDHVEQQDLPSALAFMRRVIDVDRSVGYAHALGHDLVDLADIQLLRGERSEARVNLQEALLWFGFTKDADALMSTRVQIRDLDAGHPAPAPPAFRRHGVKSHFSLGEGKVYCEFDSPVAARSPN